MVLVEISEPANVQGRKGAFRDLVGEVDGVSVSQVLETTGSFDFVVFAEGAKEVAELAGDVIGRIELIVSSEDKTTTLIVLPNNNS